MARALLALVFALSACGGKADDDDSEPVDVAPVPGASDLPITDDGSRHECWNCAGADSE